MINVPYPLTQLPTSCSPPRGADAFAWVPLRSLRCRSVIQS